MGRDVLGRFPLGGVTVPSQLLVPRDMMPGNPATADAYLAFALKRAQAAGRRLIDDSRVVYPCVNGGRWVFHCPNCESFSMVDPDHRLAACFGAGCYRVFATAVWPENRVEIETVLIERPMLRQHFGFRRALAADPAVPVETPEVLQEENRAFLRHDATPEPEESETEIGPQVEPPAEPIDEELP